MQWFMYLIWFELIDSLIDLIWFDWLIDWLSDWLDWIALEWIGLNWIGLDDIITYPYAWTVNFEICLDVQLRTYQPLIPKTSQASAWCHRYIGYWMGKTEDSPTGSRKKSEGWMPAKIPRQKWSISYLWEHFLVPDHRIPIWLVGGLADWLIGSLAHWLTHQNQCNSLGFINILKFDIERTHQNHWNSLGFIDILKLDIEWTHQNHWNSIGFSDILQTWKYHEFTKPLFL